MVGVDLAVLGRMFLGLISAEYSVACDAHADFLFFGALFADHFLPCLPSSPDGHDSSQDVFSAIVRTFLPSIEGLHLTFQWVFSATIILVAG